MELVYFIAFVAACAALVIWAVKHKDNKKLDLAHQRKLAEQKARAELLETPADYTLSHPDQPWHTRQHPATSGVVRTNAFAPRSEGAEPLYDGYSRRDRHHVRDLDARIKKEDHVDEATARAMAFREGHAAR